MTPRAAIATGALLLAASCTDRMYEQDRPDATRAPVSFAGVPLRRADGAVATVAADRADDDMPPRATRELLELGRATWQGLCMPCHDAAGTGGGIVVQRGFPRPASLHTDAQRALTDREIHRAAAAGKGRMAGFADVASARELWAVTAWVRVLQASQRVRFDELPPEWQRRVRERADGAPR